MHKNYFQINNPKKQRLFYIDYLRIICCFFVILIHVAVEYHGFNINSHEWKIVYFYEGISRFSVPVFFMISGTLFLGRELSFKIIIRKYIKNILIHLLFWSTIYSFADSNTQKRDIKKKIIQIIKGHYHLWYLFAIMGLYIVIPFNREIIKNEKIVNYLIFFNTIVVFIIPNYIHIICNYSNDLCKLSNYLFSVINLNTLTVNNFYFILGYFLNIKKGIKKKIIIIIYINGLIGLIFTTKISYNFSIIKKKKIMYFSPNCLNIFFYAIGIFLFFKNHFNWLIKLKKGIIQKLAKYTFGIYLIHPLVIEKTMKTHNIFKFNLNVIFLIPIINLIIFLVSLIICIILNNIPLIGKYLI